MSKPELESILVTLLLSLGFKSRNEGGDVSVVSQSVVDGNGSLSTTLTGRVWLLRQSHWCWPNVKMCFARIEPRG